MPTATTSRLGLLLALMALMTAACAKKSATDHAGDPSYLWVSKIAGTATLNSASNSVASLSSPAPNLTADHLQLHLDGDQMFERSFIPGLDDSRPGQIGLGPVFNNTSCLNCHARDGRGFLPPVPGDRVKLGSNESLLIRISIENNDTTKTAANGWGAPAPVPGFSAQLFHRGVFGLRADSPGSGQADIYLSYTKKTLTYPDGAQAELRLPHFAIENAYDGAQSRLLAGDVRTSPRIAPAMIGLGLIDSIPEDQILANVDAQKNLKTQVSGQPNWVFDIKKSNNGDANPISLGRFGWKASTPSLRQQTVAALSNDMGLTSVWLPTPSIFGTALYDLYTQLIGAGIGHIPAIEAQDTYVDAVTTYSSTLGVPERRAISDLQVLSGGRTFEKIGCFSCHAGPYVLPATSDFAEYNGLTIYPFTDLLLHDMGDELADNRRDFDASGRQWRTQPLWGVGLAQLVNPRAGFLHDGRARSLEEAILWHGGEAQSAREMFKNLSAAERQALIKFLGSL